MEKSPAELIIDESKRDPARSATDGGEAGEVLLCDYNSRAGGRP